MHILLHLVSETGSCFPKSLLFTTGFRISFPLFFFFFLLIFLPFSVYVHILYMLLFYWLFCLSPCSGGASPTAADESTFLPAFSLPRPWDRPQDQTRGQHLCFPVILPILSSLHLLSIYLYLICGLLSSIYSERNHHFSPTSLSWSADVRRAEA